VAVSFREVMGSMCVATLSLSRRQRCDETGDPGVRYGALFDDRDELVERSAFEVNADELRPINRRGVTPTRVGFDLEGLGRQLLSHVGVPGDQGPGGSRQRLEPVQGGLIELTATGACDPGAPSPSSMLQVQVAAIPLMVAPQKSRTGSPRRSARSRTEPIHPATGRAAEAPGAAVPGGSKPAP
jgi:hypothetical protein